MSSSAINSVSHCMTGKRELPFSHAGSEPSLAKNRDDNVTKKWGFFYDDR